MKKRSFWLITALMTIALLGVVVMQLYYIRQAYNLNSKLFEQNVSQALNTIANKVQKRYASLYIKKKVYQISQDKNRDFRDRAQQIVDFKEKHKEQEARRKLEQKKKIIANLNMRDSIVRMTFLKPEVISEDVYQEISYSTSKPSLQVQVDFGIDAFGNVRGNINQTIIPRKTSTFSLNPERMPDSIRYLAYNPKTLNPITITLERVTAESAFKFKVEDKIARQKYIEGLAELMKDTPVLEMNSLNYLEDVAKEMRQVNVPIEKRVKKGDLDLLIKKELFNRNITQRYNFWVKLANKDSLLFTPATNILDAGADNSNTYKIPLFGNDIFRDPGMLYLNFPDRDSLILGNMWATMASSAGLLLVLAFIFSYTLYTILRQKKISEMKTDFINNMTHEFKTPVSTIMIASEALKDPDIATDQSRVRRLAGIIYDENVRLGNHIERVLSIARLEKRELELEKNDVDVNELIVAVADSMSLQLQKKGAEIVLSPNAENSIVLGDELHLSNVIYNLIDNANKYSAGTPKIKVSTRSTNKNLFVEIADEGIGMTKDQTKRIFDQFYRVPTGNLHDVKGFGLGLNYVQDIVAQMNGSIKVHSEKDKGTVFEITLALK